MKQILVTVVIIISVFFIGKQIINYNKYVISIPPDICMIPGDIVMFKWDCSREDIDNAVDIWMIERGDCSSAD